MRNNQVLSIHYQITVEQDIQVNGARPVAECGFALEFGFDLLQVNQEFLRFEGGFRCQRQIEKPGLIGIPPGFGFVN